MLQVPGGMNAPGAACPDRAMFLFGVALVCRLQVQELRKACYRLQVHDANRKYIPQEGHCQGDSDFGSLGPLSCEPIFMDPLLQPDFTARVHAPCVRTYSLMIVASSETTSLSRNHPEPTSEEVGVTTTSSRLPHGHNGRMSPETRLSYQLYWLACPSECCVVAAFPDAGAILVKPSA